MIHLSEVAKSETGSQDATPVNEVERLDAGMKLGTSLREKHGCGEIMAMFAIKAINAIREYDKGAPKPKKRVVHVIRSLKHADEVDALRQVYGPGFFLLGVSSSLESRKYYLKELKGVPDSEIERLIERDDKEEKPLGQQTRKVFEVADAFVTTDDTERLSKQLSRVVDILFSKPVEPPTAEEYAMFMAYAASLRSADLGRQVGAVLVNDRGDIVSTGANDVPKFGGGLYWPGDSDARDHVWGCDYNEREKRVIAEDVAKKILGDDARREEVDAAIESLKSSKLMNITEYGRAVHAEMEALLQASRNGTAVNDCVLYATTYPCHNCAKHVVAAGVKSVVYVEPYPKSYATHLHSDAINDDGSNDEEKVEFRQFVGVGPRRFIDLFSMHLSSGRGLVRKEAGRLVEWERASAELRVPMGPLSYLDLEVSALNDLADLMEG